ncbi:MAG: PQQ-binding-like beta-propeller repeat protein [Firmicutes bacterium]|nr:PQQ-binding-like beta-propeller repeat protein [Bacillota bacterium]
MLHYQDRPQPRARPAVPWYPVALGLIAVGGFLARFVGVGRYPGLIYDEYYYVPAADVLLRRTPPVLMKNMVPGIDPNLLSHPPLSKELIALAIALFGQHAWAWRLPGVLLGSLAPLAVAGLAWELFGRRSIALGAAALAAVDGLLITMARVALPDATAVPLVLAALWWLVRAERQMQRGQVGSWGRWAGIGAVFGLALAAEWIGGQALVLAWAWLGVRWRTSKAAFWRWAVSLTVVPFLVYYASYFYAWPHGFQEPWLPRNPFWAFFRLQWLMLKDMWTLRFFHPWTASAWTWLGIPRPTALILSVTATHAIRMMAFSDPVVVWMGLAALVGGLLAFRGRGRTGAAFLFLALWFLSFYATWLLTPRSKFLYYFTTASAGLDLAAAAGMVLAWEAVRIRWRVLGRALLACLGSLGTLSIAYCFPLWVGMSMPRPFYHAIFWPASWNPRVKTVALASLKPFSAGRHPSRAPVPPWARFPATSALPPVPAPWTVFRGSIGHNSAYRAGWHLREGYALTLGTALVEAPTVSRGVAYVGTNSQQVFAIQVTSGRVLWHAQVANMAMTAPLIRDGLVVVGLGNNMFRGFSPSRGWIRGTGTNGLEALSARTGRPVWFFRTTGEDMPTPVLFGQAVYEVTGGGRLIAVSLTSGKLLWSLALGGFDSMSSPLVLGHTLYVATNSYFQSYPATRSTVWAINLLSHQVVWARNLPVASGLSDCSIASNGQTLYIAGVPAIADHGESRRLSNAFFALSARTGQVLWSRSLGAGVVSSLDQEEEGIPLVTGGVVYEGSPASHRVMAVNAATGRVIWTITLPTGVTANPVLVGAHLVVAGNNGVLYLLNARTGRVEQQDPYHFGAIGPASPLIVSNALLQSTLKGQLVVQRLGS